MSRRAFLRSFAIPLLANVLVAQDAAVTAFVQERLPNWLTFYRELHTHPELSYFEQRTAARVAERWRSAGLTVTTDVGGHGIVGVLKNGEGPTVMLRTDLDALPLREETGAPFASEVRTQLGKDEVSVMHACGHDVHMTVLTGTVEALASLRDTWRGTLLAIGQPAEERGAGAEAMLTDGLYERFPYPNFALAFHVDARLKAGTLGYTPGWVMANVDSVDIRVFGRGGHGAAPHECIDPIVIAARIVVALQTIVSRELPPTEPAVVTVGSIHGGTKHNLIPNQVDLQLTVRSYAPETREELLAAIRRITRGVALSAGVPDALLPTVNLRDQEFTPSLYNDPELVERLLPVFRRVLGETAVMRREAEMVGEDFSRYGRTKPRVPIAMFRLGTVGAEAFAAAERFERELPGLHSSRYLPDAEPSIASGVRALTAAALDLFTRR